MKMSARGKSHHAAAERPESIGCTLEYPKCCYMDQGCCLRCGWNVSEIARRAGVQRELARRGVYQMTVPKTCDVTEYRFGEKRKNVRHGDG